MATYRIEINKAAGREIEALPVQVRLRVLAAVNLLAANPRPPGVDSIKGQPGCFRIRVGDYRVIYEVKDAVLVVTVVRVGHRREVYRGK